MISWETVALTTSGNRLRYIVSSQDDAIAGLHDRPRTRNNRHRNVQCTNICDPSARNQSHVGRVRFPLRAEMRGRGHITDSCFIAFITSKIC